jgi:lipopolysaccharide transport system ATP-binding protein
MALAIKVENLSKQYRLGQIGTGTISHDLNRFWARLRGKEDPYAQIGAANDRTQKADSDYVWALKDINFEIEQGDAVGIIGRNGAGKSTLLKILSRTTLPTAGSVKMKGRIASLLEVGTGFHPEMTGRENIYQNGAILGMTRHEITRKFDEIVDFSGCEAYIDTPVKRYSSGMYVRLAFAVAAHLESEILIVDEVLAVGDAEFQKKCLGKMNDVAKGEGRTVLFVSHNMAAVKSLCNKGILLENGQITYKGAGEDCIQRYMSGNSNLINFQENLEINRDGFELHEIGMRAIKSDFNEPVSRDVKTELVIGYTNHQDGIIHFTLKFKGDDGICFMTTATNQDIITQSKGKNKVSVNFPSNFFNVGNFFVDLYIIRNGKEALYIENDIIAFTICPSESQLGSWMGKEQGYILTQLDWTLND